MARLLIALVWFCGSVTAHAAEDPNRLRDLFFGEAFFYAHQGDYFHALQRMDAELLQHYGLDEPELDALYPHVSEAEFSVGDFELSYRMHHRAGRAIKAVLEGNVPDPVRNEAAFRLARIHFQKGQMQPALHSLDRMQGQVSEQVSEAADFLRANVFLAVGRPAEATEILRKLQKANSLHGFSAYNLGIALWRSGDRQQAFQQLTGAGTLPADDPVDYAIRDKANLVLGSLLIDEGSPEAALPPLQRVRLQGPFANQALLSAGWADASARRFDRSVVSWSLLAQRDTTQATVQEAKLALPYAYSQLGVHGRAAVLYSEALNTFAEESRKLDASIASIENGHFLAALVREEIHQNKDWVVRLRTLPKTPETYYFPELLASHDFQNALQNYLDLEQLRVKLRGWQLSFAAYHDLLDARYAYYEPLLPQVDNHFRALDSRLRLRKQQARLIERRMQDLLTMPQPEMLATTQERVAHEKLKLMSAQLAERDDMQADDALRRIATLQGVLTWRIHTQFHERLTQLHKHLGELRSELAKLDEDYASYVRMRQAASHSYRGYGQPFEQLSARVENELGNVGRLMKQQGKMLEQVAVVELKRRRQGLEQYKNTARFAMADSYDRATKQLQGGGQ